jgi:hypothetical protein
MRTATPDTVDFHERVHSRIQFRRIAVNQIVCNWRSCQSRNYELTVFDATTAPCRPIPPPLRASAQAGFHHSTQKAQNVEIHICTTASRFGQMQLSGRVADHIAIFHGGPAAIIMSAFGARAGPYLVMRANVRRSLKLIDASPPGWVCQSPRY